MTRTGRTRRSASHSGDGVRSVLDGAIICQGTLWPQNAVQEILREHVGPTGTKIDCGPSSRPSCAFCIGETGGSAPDSSPLATAAGLVLACTGPIATAARRVGTQA